MADKETSSASEEHNQTTTPISDPINPLNIHAPSKAAQCSCTKITTMQLFYEMKQKFPTVPDNVVCECVGRNCHNRSACIDCLEDYPNSAKLYPQALRNQPTKKKSQPNQRSQITDNGACDKPKIQSKTVCDAASFKENVRIDENQIENVAANLNGNNVQMIASQRLKTLNLTNLNCCTRPVNRPTRVAPPPPISSASSNASPPPPKQKSQPLNLSVNVIVSSVSPTPPSSKSQQPQPISHYSFTLHQPNNNRTGNSTINPANANSSNRQLNVSADNDAIGPSLKYTSSAYDNESGYQSQFEITVAGTNSHDNQMATNRNDGNDGSADRLSENTLPSVVASSEFLEESECYVCVCVCTGNLYGILAKVCVFECVFILYILQPKRCTIKF